MVQTAVEEEGKGDRKEEVNEDKDGEGEGEDILDGEGEEGEDISDGEGEEGEEDKLPLTQ